ncbi:MAG: glutamine--tRNA ligase, partial [Desulfurivibrionaceae bacterium]
YTPAAIRNFCDRIGVAKKDSVIDVAVLEHCLREDLNDKAPRVLGVLRPLKVIIENYPEDQVEEMEAQNHPQNPEMGARKIPFCREIYIERSDFLEEAPN